MGAATPGSLALVIDSQPAVASQERRHGLSHSKGQRFCPDIRKALYHGEETDRADPGTDWRQNVYRRWQDLGRLQAHPIRNRVHGCIVDAAGSEEGS